MKNSKITLTLLAGLIGTPAAHTAVFNPLTVADLISDINTANGNNEADVIDLGGNGFSLNIGNYANDLTDGRNGLPSILSDSGSSLTIQNGKIVRSSVSPSDAFRLLHISSGATLNLVDVTLANGLATASDISVLGISGGAIFNNQGNLNIEQGTFNNNQAGGFGGALTNFSGAQATIQDSSFMRNSAVSLGGAIHNDPSCTIPSIANSLFADNTSGTNGGAISNFTGSIGTIINSTFSNNIANDMGGAISNSSSASISKIYNSTIASNFAGNTGGGIWNESSSGSAIGTLESTIVADNHAIFSSDIASSFTNASFNLVGDGEGCNILNSIANNQVGTALAPLDPRLGRLTDNGGLTQTRAIASASPAHNAGSNPNGIANDQRGPGFPRSVSETDIGAYEIQ